MARWLPSVLAALALALGAWNAWQVGRVQARVAAFEKVAAAPAPRGSAAEGRPVRPGPPEAGHPAKVPPQIAEDPELRERFLAALDERTERFRETVRDEVSRFAEEQGVDDATIEAVLTELDRRSIETDAIRADLKDGNIDRTEARQEIEDLRVESDATLEDLLGRHRFEQLAERLFGDRSPGAPGSQLGTSTAGRTAPRGP